MFRMFTETLALSLVVLGMTSALAFAQSDGSRYDTRKYDTRRSDTGRSESPGIAGSAGTGVGTGAAVSDVGRPTSRPERYDPMGRADYREDPNWYQSWNYVGSGGNNVGLSNARNPYAESSVPPGFNSPGADRWDASRNR
jgi:hypothetical protein